MLFVTEPAPPNLKKVVIELTAHQTHRAENEEERLVEFKEQWMWFIVHVQSGWSMLEYNKER